jgi:hypothetical protein
MVSSLKTKTLNDVVIKMVEEGTGLTRPQAMAYFEKLTQTIVNFLQEGYSVNTPFFRVRPSISGVFAKYNDLFDPNKHQLNFRLNAGPRLQPVLANISIEKDKSRIPVLDTFFDGMSRQTNTVITPGGNAEIKGECLSFNPEDLKQGVFFIPVNSPEVEIRALAFLKVNFREISFMIPNLEPGAYRVNVKTISADGVTTMNSGLLKQNVTVL